MNPKLSEALASLTYRITRLDKIFRYYQRIREEIVLLVGDENFFKAYNDLAYTDQRMYDPSSHKFRDKLYLWEETAIQKYFPPPPTHLLIGGAGGGREVFALAEKGYEVTAFEHCPHLVREMNQVVKKNKLQVQVYQGSFQDLWSTQTIKPNTKDELSSDISSIPKLPPADEHPKYDGIILGWGAITHIAKKEDRVQLFKTCSHLLSPGDPLLSSFFFKRKEKTLNKLSKGKPRFLSRIKNKFRDIRKVDPNASFLAHAGYAHYFNERELMDLARNASLEIIHLSHDEGVYPHSVMKKHDNS